MLLETLLNELQPTTIATPTKVYVSPETRKKSISFTEMFENILDFYELKNTHSPNQIQGWLQSKGLKNEEDLTDYRNKIADVLRVYSTYTDSGKQVKPFNKNHIDIIKSIKKQ